MTVKASLEGRVIPLRVRVSLVERDVIHVAETGGQAWSAYVAVLSLPTKGTDWACGWDTPEALEFKARLALLA